MAAGHAHLIPRPRHPGGGGGGRRQKSRSASPGGGSSGVSGSGWQESVRTHPSGGLVIPRARVSRSGSRGYSGGGGGPAGPAGFHSDDECLAPVEVSHPGTKLVEAERTYTYNRRVRSKPMQVCTHNFTFGDCSQPQLPTLVVFRAFCYAIFGTIHYCNGEA